MAQANYLGNSKNSRFDYLRISSKEAEVMPSGLVRLNWLDPSTNIFTQIDIVQWSAIEIPESVIELVEGKPVTCSLLVTDRGVHYGDCSFFLEEKKDGASALLALILEANPSLLGCNKYENDLIKNITGTECWKGD
ncbi:MAG: hypothetical protein ABJH45_10825 [Paracoccaceae bacterium]